MTTFPSAGWLNVFKPFGVSSASVVHQLKRILGVSKIGHGGTLDPYATGILPIAFGQATKTVSFVMGSQKIYRFIITFGKQTTTDDGEGDVIALSTKRPTHAMILDVLPRFIGTIWQRPPIYSALKVDGRRSYALARAGVSVHLEPRQVVVFSLALICADDASATFVATTGSGVYIRSLARDIAICLGTVGYVSSLTRTAVGRFTEKTSISAESLYTLSVDERLAHVMPMDMALDDILGLSVSASVARAVRLGQRPFLEDVTVPSAASSAGFEAPIALYCSGCLIAIGHIIDGHFISARVFYEEGVI